MATNKLEIYRGEILHLTVDIDERTMFSHTILAEHKIEATFVYPEPVDLREGDYIIHQGQNFYINQPPSYVKYNNFTYVYTVNFEHEIYKLYNAIMLHLGAMDFTFFGNAQAHLQLVIDNINRVDSGWSIGLVEQTDELLITYGEQNKGTKCRNALTQICEAFNLEFSYNNKSINLVRQAGVNTGLYFEYGRGKGLYEIERLTPENYHPVTKLYIFGSKTNIPLGYRNGAQRLTTDTGFVDRPLEPNEQQREDSYIFEDIFPNRTGSVSAVDSENIFKFTDSSLDFDINENIIPGVTPMVVFKSGDLSGNEFEIQHYDHATKTFTIIENVEENGYVIPNTVVGISVGDEYTLTGISLPQSYIDDAEARLEERGLEKINEQNRLPYSCKIDEKYIRDNGVVINAGDRVNIKDEALNIDEVIRITTVSYPLVVPERIDIVISDKLLYTKIDREILDRKKEQNIINQEVNNNYELARRQAARFRQMQDLIFDPEGYFDPEKIKPFSIETYMLTVGAKSQNFGLNGVAISPNHLGNPNNMQVTAGKLVHYEVEIEGVGNIWEIPLANFNGLDPVKSYYLYAQCSKTQLIGTWMLSETPVLTDDPNYAGFWNFNVGILYDVKEGRRDFDFTKGMSYFVGDTITTGRIKSLDGLNYFDLTQNRFKLGGLTSGLDWNVTTPNKLTLLGGGIIQSRGGTVDFIGSYTGNYNNSKLYYLGDIVKYSDGNYYKYINQDVQGVSGIIPTNTTYWRISTERGPQGLPGAPGVPGIPGQDGQDGHRGPSLTPRGLWEAGKTYRGTELMVDGVLYGGSWYFAKFNIGTIPAGTLPTNEDWWEPVGGQFESVATGLLLASLAYITNLGVRYLETSPPGSKRVEINGDENNIRVLAPNNRRHIELDDDTAKVIGSNPFYIEFSTSNMPSPNEIATNPTGDKSMYNSGSIDSRTGLQGNWSNGFPLTYSGLYDSVSSGTRRRYYFYGGGSGIMIQDALALSDPTQPVTSISHDFAVVKNLSVSGMFGNGQTRRVLFDYTELDSGAVPDSVILYEASSNGTFVMDDIMTTSVFNLSAIRSNVYGRVLEFVNLSSTSSLTIQAQTQVGMFRIGTSSVNTIVIGANQTARIKLISLQDLPLFPGNWRWQLISRHTNI